MSTVIPNRAELDKKREEARKTEPPQIYLDAWLERKPVASLFRLELSLADLDAERIFRRTGRGDFLYSGSGEFQYSDGDL